MEAIMWVIVLVVLVLLSLLLFSVLGVVFVLHTLLKLSAYGAVPFIKDIMSAMVLLALLPLGVLMIVAVWKIFNKVGMPGFGAIIPIYNTYLMVKLAGWSGWWLFMPLGSIVIGILIPIDIARIFGKGFGFGLGLVFLPFIFYPILGFGSVQYTGPVHKQLGCGTIVAINFLGFLMSLIIFGILLRLLR